MTVLGSTAIEFDLNKHIFKKLSIHELVIDLQDKNKIYWIHCCLNEKEMLDKLSQMLQLPEEVIRLCNEKDTMPKLIDNDAALTIQIQCLLSTELNYKNEAAFSNLIMHLTPKFCFTAAKKPLPPLLEFINSYQKAIRYAKTPCFILFLILDNVINDFARVFFNFELVSEQMDLRVHTDHKNIYNEVIDVKQQTMNAKHYMIAIREILMRISGRNISVISDECRTSLYNLSNHAHMVIHEADSIRDMLNSMLDQIDNALMQKMSETMKVLTAFAAIFLPLTLITGIYGMNFKWMPELSWKYGYFFVLGLIFLCGLILLMVFKKMKWF